MSLALAGRFLSTGPPGESKHVWWTNELKLHRVCDTCVLWLQLPFSSVPCITEHFYLFSRSIYQRAVSVAEDPACHNTQSSLVIAFRKMLRPYLPSGRRPNSENIRRRVCKDCISLALWRLTRVLAPQFTSQLPPHSALVEASAAAVWNPLVWKWPWIIEHWTRSWALRVAPHISGAVK